LVTLRDLGNELVAGNRERRIKSDLVFDAALDRSRDLPSIEIERNFQIGFVNRDLFQQRRIL
jgi:hypothetical protein